MRSVVIIGVALLTPLALGIPASNAAPAPGAFTGVLTFHNDNLRTGQNLQEKILRPANVNAGRFGLLFTLPVDGQIYAQPLYMPAVAMPNRGVHNVVIVATENDTVYAFDADSAGPPLWQTSLAINGATAIPAADSGCADLAPQIGITSTPVIDPATATLYVVAATKEADKSYVFRLHALDIGTGMEAASSPVVIQSSIPSGSVNAVGGAISLSAFRNHQRAALLLDMNVIYIAFASHCDFGQYNGFVLGYDKTSLAQVAQYSDETNGVDGGIWMSGDGLASDSSGDIYLATGNGTFDADGGGPDYGDSLVRLTPQGDSFTIKSYFAPSGQDILDRDDYDLGSGGMLLLPDEPRRRRHLALGGGKQGTLYLVNRDAMGGYKQGPGGSDNAIEEIGGVGGIYSAPAYFHSYVYLVPANSQPKQFQLWNGFLSRTPVATFPLLFKFNGASPSISAHGRLHGIVWLIRNSSSGNAVLYALDALRISRELYDSAQNPARDTAGPFNKFQTPTIANGKVYVGTQTQLAVYGLLRAPRAGFVPAARMASTPPAANLVTVTHSVTGSARRGYPRSGGSFMLTNLSGADETIGSVVIAFSNAAMFKSAVLEAMPGRASWFAGGRPPTARTAFSFTTPLTLRAGASATFRLKIVASGAMSAPSAQVVIGINASNAPVTRGLPASLGTVSPSPD